MAGRAAGMGAGGMGGIAVGTGAGPSGSRSSYLLGRRYVRLGLPVAVRAGGAGGGDGGGGPPGGGRGARYISSISISLLLY
jgi:hypothetical protein